MLFLKLWRKLFVEWMKIEEDLLLFGLVNSESPRSFSMELASGFPLLCQQFRALFKKNLLLSWRSKCGTFVQLFSSFFFIFFIFCIQKSLEAQSASDSANKRITDPTPLVSPPIPPCEDKNFIRQPCFDFLWSGDGSPKIRSIVDAIMANNPGRPIPSAKVILIIQDDEIHSFFLLLLFREL